MHIQFLLSVTLFFDMLHTCAECDKDTFVDYVNVRSSKDWRENQKYERVPAIDVLFDKLQFPGVFQVKGHEVLGSDPYIMHKDIKTVLGL